MVREFIYDGKSYPDPDPNLSTDEVRQNLANFFPELSNAETKETKRGDDKVFTFTKRTGTKGEQKREIPAIEIREVKELPDSVKYIEITSIYDSPEGDAKLLSTASEWLSSHSGYTLLGLNITTVETAFISTEGAPITRKYTDDRRTLTIFVEI